MEHQFRKIEDLWKWKQGGEFESCFAEIQPFLAWQYNKLLVLFLSLPSKKACHCQSVMPFQYYCIICEQGGVKNKNSNRIEWFYWLCEVNWPFSNQANKLSHCSDVLDSMNCAWQTHFPHNPLMTTAHLYSSKEKQQENSGPIKAKHGKHGSSTELWWYETTYPLPWFGFHLWGCKRGQFATR